MTSIVIKNVYISSPKEKQEVREMRKFFVLLALVLLIGNILKWHSNKVWVADIVIGATLCLRAQWLKYPFRLVMKVTHAIETLNSYIILFIMYWLIFVPFGVILRFVGKDPLEKKFDKNRDTYKVSGDSHQNNLSDPF